MLQKQMPVWVSHYPPDSCQEDGDRPAATCALEVRAKGWVGGPGAEGRRHTQRGLGSRQTPDTRSTLARAAPAWHWGHSLAQLQIPTNLTRCMGVTQGCPGASSTEEVLSIAGDGSHLATPSSEQAFTLWTCRTACRECVVWCQVKTRAIVDLFPLAMKSPS